MTLAITALLQAAHAQQIERTVEGFTERVVIEPQPGVGFSQQLPQLVLLLLQLLHPPARFQFLPGPVEHGAALAVALVHRQQLLLQHLGLIGVDPGFEHRIHLALHQG